MDSWGTPDVDTYENDFTPLHSTDCLRFAKCGSITFDVGIDPLAGDGEFY